MSVIVTQNYRQSRLRKVSWNWNATEFFVVTGLTDKNDAIEAAVAFNSPHPDNPLMTAGDRDATQTAPQAFLVKAEYSFGDHGTCASSPLSENPKILYEPLSMSMPRDIDVNSNAILNSAGDPFNPGATRIATGQDLIVRKWLPVFNVGSAIMFTDTVNSAPFSIAGAGGVDTGQAICRYIKPVQEYTLIAPFVFVEYRFSLIGGTQPWQFKPIDAGRNGWCVDTSYEIDGVPIPTTVKGPIVDKGGNQPPFDVRLDGTGKPIDSQWMVMDTTGTPQAPVSNPTPPAGLTTDPDLSGPLATTLIWQDLTATDFSTIGL